MTLYEAVQQLNAINMEVRFQQDGSVLIVGPGFEDTISHCLTEQPTASLLVEVYGSIVKSSKTQRLLWPKA